MRDFTEPTPMSYEKFIELTENVIQAIGDAERAGICFGWALGDTFSARAKTTEGVLTDLSVWARGL